MNRAIELLTEDGLRLPLGKRTGAVVMEIYALRERIDGTSRGQVEILIDFKDGSLFTSVKEMAQRKKIE